MAGTEELNTSGKNVNIIYNHLYDFSLVGYIKSLT